MNFLQVWACLKKKDSVKILPLRHTHPHSRWNYSLLPEVTGSRGFVVFLGLWCFYTRTSRKTRTDMKTTVLPSFYWPCHILHHYRVLQKKKKKKPLPDTLLVTPTPTHHNCIRRASWWQFARVQQTYDKNGILTRPDGANTKVAVGIALVLNVSQEHHMDWWNITRSCQSPDTIPTLREHASLRHFAASTTIVMPCP